MSQVTEIVLLCSGAEEVNDAGACPLLDAVDAWTRARGYGCLARLQCLAGGTKVFPSILCAGAFDHFALKEFFVMLRGLSWESPEAVQVFFKTEDELFVRRNPFFDVAAKVEEP